MRPHDQRARPLLRGCAVVAALASVLGHGPLAPDSGSKAPGWAGLEVSGDLSVAERLGAWQSITRTRSAKVKCRKVRAALLLGLLPSLPSMGTAPGSDLPPGLPRLREHAQRPLRVEPRGTHRDVVGDPGPVCSHRAAYHVGKPRLGRRRFLGL